VTGGNTGNCKRETQRDVDRVAVGSEANFAAYETFETTQRRVSARLPCPPDSLGSLAGVYVTSPFNAVTAVNLVPAVDAVSTDKPIQAGSNRFRGRDRFD